MADTDQAEAAEDQARSDADQAASDRDQGASDRERDQADSGGARLSAAYAASRAERARSTAERRATSELRSLTMFDRSNRAAMRDEQAALRDTQAIVRDRTAELRDQAAMEHERALGLHTTQTSRARQTAAADRERAAEDRAHAAEDRMHAAEDRERAHAELADAQLDDLTGLFRRSLGRTALQREIDRSQRSGGKMVLAYCDLDDLKSVNDEQGHATGDALLKGLADAIRARLRSYDVTVRMGGDEFVCALSDTDMDQATHVFEEIQHAFSMRAEGGGMSFGLAALGPEDSLDELLERGDAALCAAKPR
jgi:diguanylate cyclase (GGDEF)-like protein